MKLSQRREILVLLGLCSWMALAFYGIFYFIAPWIWRLNLNYRDEQICQHMRIFFKERDGAEGYVLYFLLFGFSIATCYLTWRILKEGFQTLLGKYWLIIIPLGFVFPLIAFLLGYFFQIGFVTPIDFHSMSLINYFQAAFAIAAMFACLYLLANWNSKMLWVGVIGLLLPLCFITQESIDLQNYNYVLAPGLCIYQHQAWDSIYFQYDVLLSLLAAVWFKLNWDLNSFQLVGQASMFLLFLGAFYWGKTFWGKDRFRFTILFFLTLLMVRYFSLYCEMSTNLQTSPIRLDWWLAILLLAQSKGAKHWSVGLLLGFLYVFHRNFGLIYTITYLQWIIVNWLINCKTYTLKQVVKDYYKPLVIIVGSIIISAILFKGFIPESALLYQGVGIGMIRIGNSSFFWLMLPIMLLAPAFGYLNYQNGKLSTEKWKTLLLLTLLNIGNLLYFFGRSHENNLLHVSAPMVLLLFASISQLPHQWSKWLLPIIFLLTFIYVAPHLRMKLGLKGINLFRNHQLLQPIKDNATREDVNTVLNLTHCDKKVFITDYKKEVLLNYHCGLKCLGRYQPTSAWFFEPARSSFMNGLLNQGYAIVTSDSAILNQAILPLRDGGRIEVTKQGGYWKVNRYKYQ